MNTILRLNYGYLFIVLFLVGIISCKKEEQDTIPPGDVTNCKKIIGASEITLTWTDPTDKDFSKVEITYKGIKTEVAKGTQFLKISNLKNHIFTIKTIDESGNKSAGIQIDYRYNYTGNYTFTTIAAYWMLHQPTNYDTLVYNGNVSIYGEGDNLNDLSPSDDSTENNSIKVTIEFLSNKIITPEILESGVFINKPAYHYYHTGSFITNDSISFQIGGLGAQGAGTNYSIIGVKN